MNADELDYRQSHIRPNMGCIYDLKYECPHVKMVWEWEKEILIHLVTKLNRVKPRQKYLDFACGTGRILSLLEPYVDDAYGVDISEEMLRVAREKIHKATLLQCDLTHERRFEERSFDLISAFRFFLYAQPELKEDVLVTLSRLIKPDGYFVFNIHCNSGCLLAKEFEIYQWLTGKKVRNFNTMSVTEVRNLLAKANFEIAEMFHYGVFPVVHEDRKFLIPQLTSIERYLARLPWLLPFSQHIIYVCRLKQPAGTE